jgi:hypothetical protein
MSLDARERVMSFTNAGIVLGVVKYVAAGSEK